MEEKKNQPWENWIVLRQIALATSSSGSSSIERTASSSLTRAL